MSKEELTEQDWRDAGWIKTTEAISGVYYIDVDRDLWEGEDLPLGTYLSWCKEVGPISDFTLPKPKDYVWALINCAGETEEIYREDPRLKNSFEVQANKFIRKVELK